MTADLRHTPLPNLLIRNRNFVLLWLAYGVAAIGDHLSEMALLNARGGLDRPDATRVQALITFGFFLPFVVLAPIAGWWSDRFSRRSTMIAADLLRAVLVFNLAVIVAKLAHWLEPHGFGDYSVVLPLGLVGALAAFFSPARQAMLPTLIRDDQLVRANSLISAMGTIGGILGSVLGGVLVLHTGPEWNYHINALTYVGSAICVSLILMSRSRAVPHAPLDGIWMPVKAGFHYVSTHRRVLQMILLGTLFWGLAGVVISIVPALVREVFHGSIQDVGIYRGLIVVGLAMGAAVMSILGPAMPAQIAVMAALLGGTLWLTVLDATYLLKLGRFATGLALFGIGGAGAALLVTIMASIQRFVPDSRRGRVFGVSDMATMGALVATSGALGLPHIPNLDRYIPVLLAGCAAAMFIAAIVSYRVYRRGDPDVPVTSFMLYLIRFYARFWCRIRRDGPCTVPQAGPVIVAANHTSGIDPLMLLATCRHRLISFIVAEEYYNQRVGGWFMRLNHCVPVRRENPGKAFLVRVLRMLKDGGCLGIFPQGRFEAPDADPVDARSGIGLLALRTGATVIPCHISGVKYHEDVLPGFLSRHNVRVRYGKPVDLTGLAGMGRDKAAAEQASERIMAAIRALGPAEA